MRIGVCDNCSDERDVVVRQIAATANKLEMECQIYQFLSEKELICFTGELEVLVLELKTFDKNVKEVRKILQKLKVKALIVIAGSREKTVIPVLGLSAVSLIVKQDLTTQIENALEETLDIISDGVMLEGKFDSSDIMYIRSERIYSYLVRGTEQGGLYVRR